MNTESESERAEPSQLRLRPSCLPCQRSKKKCDRRRPQCSLCVRHRRACHYDARSSSAGSASHTSGIPDAQSHSHVDAPQHSGKPFPAVFFLDSVLFQRSVNKLPDLGFTLDPDLLSFVGNVFADKEFIATYFTFTHPWIPFLSKKLFMERTLNPLLPAKPENTLLVAAMKLVANSPCGGDARTPQYFSIKDALFRAERFGVLEFKVFQATILVAIYELGHAIYPAAHSTIGNCVRYGSALGVNNTVETTHLEEGQSSTEGEERRRSWWAVVVLDRFMNLGCAERACLFRDPSSYSILPMDDGVWERGGHSGRNVHFLSSPPTETMGRYCLTAQAASLLGRVFRNINDDPGIEGFREDEVKVLESALIALTNVSLQEGRDRGIGVCSPTTICFSARLLLHDEERYPKGKYPDVIERSRLREIESDIAAYMLRLARSVSGTGRCGIEEISPFCLEAMYRSGIVYARRYSETGYQDDLDAFETVKAGLGAMGSRWKAAESYISMLAARELTGIL
ncbi:hypothetical protein B0T10DRAFT_234210 [Thelonectria olida]|uniref:Zn(2)-C6 fungal-type domain-containing protein n=1 Tax=Thelonectria olida TaxID=1576542 RepID=A0A9P9AI94_9HYPO|nr:hypothetical protein B0T10DRAFT_234210 [Thelonectria olida]